jgi:hypothetical protein
MSNVTLRHICATIIAMGNAISITYYCCVSMALSTQYAMCMCHIVTCGLPDSTLFFHVISQMAQFKKKKLTKKCVVIFSTTFV